MTRLCWLLACVACLCCLLTCVAYLLVLLVCVASLFQVQIRSSHQFHGSVSFSFTLFRWFCNPLTEMLTME